MSNYFQYYETELLYNLINILFLFYIYQYFFFRLYKHKIVLNFLFTFFINSFFFCIFINIFYFLNNTQVLLAQFLNLSDFTKFLNLTFYSKIIPISITFIFDNISLGFVFLTLFITFLCCNLNIYLNTTLQNKNINLFIFLSFMLILCFITTDFLTFFFSFESTLIPLLTLLFLFGTRAKKTIASWYLLIYTLFGSIFLLTSLILLYGLTNSLNIYNIFYFFILNKHNELLLNFEYFIWIFLFISFSIKIPTLPFQKWLPEAHVESSTPGSVLLAAILLKIGGYGIIRFLIFIFPYTTFELNTFIQLICLISALYASLIALTQTDFKRIIAYSSISHMNFGILGLFNLNLIGFYSAFCLMIGHGVIAAGLFILVGFLYDRTKTRLIYNYGGLSNIMPIWTNFFFFFTLANMSFPLTVNFFGEFFTLVSLTQHNIFLNIFVNLIIIFTIAFALLLYNKLISGTSRIIVFKHITFIQLTWFEISLLICLGSLILLFGFLPNTIIN